jgi:XTP/dITP diphosphohydrolase
MADLKFRIIALAPAPIRSPQSSMIKLLIATSNSGKIAELAALLSHLPCQVIGLSDLPQPLPLAAETGASFAENALMKAEHYSALTGLLTLADDSGLEVDALGGAPGIYSARFAGEGASDAERVAKLLGEIKDEPDAKRTARFVCSIAIVGPHLKRTFEGRCEGVIARAPRGSNGFGYDPIFIDPELGRTFAELTREEKAARSHRGRALKAARRFLAEWLRKAAQE